MYQFEKVIHRIHSVHKFKKEMKFFKFPIWFTGFCAILLVAETEAEDPADLVEFLKILGGMTMTNVQLERTALDVNIASLIAAINDADYDYYYLASNLHGVYYAVGEVWKALRKLEPDVEILAWYADTQDVPQENLDAVSDDLQDVSEALSVLNSNIEALLTKNVQKTKKRVSLSQLASALDLVSAAVDDVTDAVLDLKSASYLKLQLFFCVAVGVSQLCKGLNDVADALDFLARVVKKKASELNDPKATAQSKLFIDALIKLASKLRCLCVALNENCPIPTLPKLA